MSEAEAARLWSSGADPLVVRLAMDPEIPIDYATAHEAPISVLLQLEVIADARARIARRRALIDAARRR